MLHLLKKICCLFIAVFFATELSGQNSTRFVLPVGLAPSEYMAKTIIVKVRSEFRSACSNDKINNPSFNQLYAAIGGKDLNKKFPREKAPEKMMNAQGERLADLSLIYEFSYTLDVDFVKIINKFKNTGIFEYVEPHYIPHLCYTPNDPGLALQYGIGKIQAENAWGVNTTTARGDTNVVIGITDTGTEPTHDDLKNNLKHNYADYPDGFDNDGDGFIDNFSGWDLGENDNDPTYNANSHGVHVCGIAAASVDNATGGVGVGFNCKFLPVKIADATGALTKAYEGIQYAAAHGCAVINCSWGGSAAGQFQQDVVTYATINQNSLVVAAAGNNGSNVSFYPASLHYVISVANTNSSDVASTSSNYGYDIDVCAPGENIYSTYPVNSYSYQTGTSMASPCAAGAAAIIKSFYPFYTALQLGEQLKVTCDDIYALNSAVYTNKLGNGRVNLFKALTVTSSPSICFSTRNMTDNNDNAFAIGDTIRISGIHTNYLSGAANVNATLTAIGSTSAFITILDGTTNLGAMGMLGTADNTLDPFMIKVLPSAPSNVIIQFKLTYTDAATSYSHSEYFTVVVNEDYVNIAINDVATTMTSSGRIGYRADGQAGGLGFNYMNGGTLLYEAGLMIGDNSTRVSDVVRGVTGGVSDADFISVVKAHRIIPAVYSEFDADATINDAGSGNPLPVLVKNKAFAWTTAGNTKYVIFQYNIINTGTIGLDSVYAGIFADWDIDAATFGSDKASFDAANKMGYAYYSGASGKYAGIKLLTSGAPVNHYAIDNVAGGAGGLDPVTGNFSTDEKYLALSTPRSDAGVPGAGADICDVVSSGPFSIATGDSIKVAFALIAGDSLADLQNSAVNAQIMYDGLAFVSVPETKLDENSMFIYPNPADGRSIIELNLNEISAIDITLCDVLGRVVKTVVSERMSAGKNQLSVDVSGLSNGIYTYSIRIGDKKYARKLMIAR